MKINKNTWHYKLWRQSFGYMRHVPEETDLCRYCHKVFWQMIGIAAICGMILAACGGVLGLLFILAYQGFWLHTGTTLKVLGVVAAVVIPIVFYVRWLSNNRKPVPNNGLVSNWVAARKQNVCPLVEFAEDD